MLNILTQKLVINLKENNIITTQESELYIYGIYHGLVIIVNVMVMILIGIIMQSTVECIIFVFAYFFLRIYAGGFHAKSQGVCFLLSNLLIIIALICIKYIVWNAYFMWSIFSISSIIVYVVVPVEAVNKPLEADEVKKYRKNARIILLAEIAIHCLLTLLRVPYLNSISIAVIIMSIMLLAGKGKVNVNLVC